MINPATQEQVLDPETHTPVRDPAQIETAASVVRAQVRGLGHTEQGRQIKTPDSIIQDLEVIKAVAADNVEILREADRTRRAARRMHSRARLVAMKRSELKSADERKAEAEEACMAEWELADSAEVAYEYAKSVAGLVDLAKSATQTQSKQVEIMYQLAGRGQ
ncbi:hypothetical protein [Subtercola sp. YIM 133946]|uniref:hypothetical protein n=1 Tax=Subtercola sp. YIM 133946 TaxID=3118909 RepID=UPI002F933A7A